METITKTAGGTRVGAGRKPDFNKTQPVDSSLIKGRPSGGRNKKVSLNVLKEMQKMYKECPKEDRATRLRILEQLLPYAEERFGTKQLVQTVEKLPEGTTIIVKEDTSGKVIEVDNKPSADEDFV